MPKRIVYARWSRVYSLILGHQMATFKLDSRKTGWTWEDGFLQFSSTLAKHPGEFQVVLIKSDVVVGYHWMWLTSYRYLKPILANKKFNWSIPREVESSSGIHTHVKGLKWCFRSEQDPCIGLCFTTVFEIKA